MYQNHSTKREMYYDKVCSMYYDQGLSTCRIAAILPISKTAIARWIINFAQETGITNPHKMKGKSNKPKRLTIAEQQTPPLSTEVLELQAQVKKLQKDLYMANMRADLYEEIINVAEQKFNISIRKKAGTK